MKYIVLTVAILLSFKVWGQDTEYKILSLWKNKEAPEGKTYLAAVRNTIPYSDAGDWLVIFGTKNKKMKKRAFTLEGFSFYTYDGASNSGMDDFYKMKYEVRGEELTVDLTPRRFGKAQQVVYKQYESTGSTRFANKVIKEVLKEQEALRSATELKTLAQFKQRLDLVRWDFGFGANNDDVDFPFPVYDLQIEWYYQNTLSDKKLATTLIKFDGSDDLSKKFKEGKKWMKDADDAISAVEEEIEQGLNTDDWDYEVGTYSAFSKVASRLEDKVLSKAAKKFVRYEITNATGFECEDGIYTWESITWVLTDGSTYSYSPGTECD